jgi:hypothetical protein
MMSTCGLWPAARHLVAVVADDDGMVVERARKVSYSNEARWALLDDVENHHGLDCAIVVTVSLARADSIARIAARRRAPVWVVDDAFIDDLRVLACGALASSRQLALLLARLPLCAPLRTQLRSLRLQLPLFAHVQPGPDSLCL